MELIWITGAGRSGTHLLGMLADGHPQVNVFPWELRVVQDWPDLVTLAGTDSQRVPGPMLDRYMVSRYLGGPEWRGRFAPATGGEMPQGSHGPFGLQAYLASLNRRLFPGDERRFLFHCPGCQVQTFLNSRESGTRGRVVLMLRHPLQNYLAWVDHYLQKGGGYCRQEHIRPDVGLLSILHLSLLRVMKAFAVAAAFNRSPDVLISRLEDFTARPEERRRVWDFLRIPEHPALERTTRRGLPQDARSGRWRVSHIKQVSENLYAPLLTAEECRAFQRCEPLFAPYYPQPLKSVKTVSAGGARDLLYRRERACLQGNLHARQKRKERFLNLLRVRRLELWGVLSWPLRALYTLAADGPLYPLPHLLRSARGYGRALTGLEDVADFVGSIPPRDRPPDL